jgi:hypothetical protein
MNYISLLYVSAVVVGATTVQKIIIEGGSTRRDFPELDNIPLVDESGKPTVIEADPVSRGPEIPAVPGDMEDPPTATGTGP